MICSRVMEKETGCRKTIDETYHIQYFFKPEVEYYFKELGFELVDNLDCAALGEDGYNSWTNYFVARAI